MLKEEIRNLIKSVITHLGFYSVDAVELMMLTCSQESHLGKLRFQPRRKTCFGIFQMNVNTFNDIVNNYLKFKPELRMKVMEVSGVKNFIASDMAENDRLAICMCRIHYLRKTEKLPSCVNVEEMAYYYEKYYDITHNERVSNEAVINYKRFAL